MHIQAEAALDISHTRSFMIENFTDFKTTTSIDAGILGGAPSKECLLLGCAADTARGDFDGEE